MDVPISGTCEPGFEAVREVFAQNFAERGEVGAAVCVLVGGRPVVDLVGGWADEARTRVWRPDTLVNVYSVGKGVLSLLVLQLVDEGLITLDTPIAAVWPEFAAHGKGGVTVGHALQHRAGLPAIRERLTDADLVDWERMTAALAATEPWFAPTDGHTYHTNTFGHLLGEVVRRVTGELPGARLRRVAAPLASDVFWGLRDAELARCADVIWAPSVQLDGIDPFTLEGTPRMVMMGYVNPPGYSSNGVVNSEAWRRAQVPATNLHATARGVATLYAGIIGAMPGLGPLLSPALLAHATRVHSEGFCPVLGEDVQFGLGFTPTTARRPLGTNPHSFGHFGTGGALGFADPDAGVSFGYVMNHVIPRWQSTRNRSLVDALYGALA